MNTLIPTSSLQSLSYVANLSTERRQPSEAEIPTHLESDRTNLVVESEDIILSDNGLSPLQKIEELINKDSDSEEWIDTLERLVPSLPHDEYYSPSSLSINWPIFLNNVKSIITKAEPTIVMNQIRIDGQLLILHRIIRMLKRFQLVDEFKKQCMMDPNTYLSIPSSFILKYIAKSEEIPGWEVIPNVLEYIQNKKALISNTKSTFSKIKRKDSNLKISLIFHRESAEHHFDIYATREWIGLGGIKKVKELVSLTYPDNTKVKYTPHYKEKFFGERTEFLIRKASDMMVNEARLAQNLIGLTVPHILPMQIHHYGEKAVILSDICEGIDLNHYFFRRHLPKGDLSTYQVVKESLETLQLLHTLGYCYLDYKMGNILVKIDDTRAHARMSDLGSIHTTGTLIGDIATYPSPEMVKSKDNFSGVQATPSIDMWCVGLVLFSIRTGYQLKNYNLDCQYIQTIPARIKWRENVTRLREDFRSIKNENSELDNVIEKLLDDDPLKRPCSSEVLATLDRLLKNQDRKEE